MLPKFRHVYERRTEYSYIAVVTEPGLVIDGRQQRDRPGSRYLGLRTQHHPPGFLQRLLEGMEGSMSRTAFVHGAVAFVERLDRARASVRRSLAGD